MRACPVFGTPVAVDWAAWGGGASGCVLRAGFAVADGVGLDGVVEGVSSPCCMGCDVVDVEREGSGLPDLPVLPCGTCFGVCFGLGAVVDGAERTVADVAWQVVAFADGADEASDAPPLCCRRAAHAVTFPVRGQTGGLGLAPWMGCEGVPHYPRGLRKAFPRFLLPRADLLGARPGTLTRSLAAWFVG